MVIDISVTDLENLKKLSILRSQLDGFSIADLKSDKHPTVGPEERVAEALSKMRESGFQEIPVMEDGKYIGVISYGHILKKRSITPDSKIRGAMRSLPAVAPDMDVTKVAEMIVATNCRQLPLVSGSDLIGMVSRSNLTKIAREMKILREIGVWEIMTSPVESVNRNMLLDDALEIMRHLDVKTVPVVDDNSVPCGMVGMKEIIDNHWKTDTKSFGDFQKSNKAQITIESVCTTSVKSLNWNSTVNDAIALMDEYRFSTIPVTEDGRLVGIITEYDIVQLIASCRERESLFVQISGLDDEDKVYTDSMYEDIRREMSKISKIYRPETLTIYVSRSNEDGGRKKYTMSGKLFINGMMFNAKVVDWDIIETNSSLIRKLSEMVRDSKESVVSRRKKASASKNGS